MYFSISLWKTRHNPTLGPGRSLLLAYLSEAHHSSEHHPSPITPKTQVIIALHNFTIVYLIIVMAESPFLVNALHSSVVDRMDPQFAEIYTKHQGLFQREATINSC